MFTTATRKLRVNLVKGAVLVLNILLTGLVFISFDLGSIESMFSVVGIAMINVKVFYIFTPGFLPEFF